MIGQELQDMLERHRTQNESWLRARADENDRERKELCKLRVCDRNHSLQTNGCQVETPATFSLEQLVVVVSSLNNCYHALAFTDCYL